MYDTGREDGGLLGLLHSFARLFRRETVASAEEAAEPEASAGLAKLESEFAEALGAMKARIDQQSRTGTTAHSGRAPLELGAQDRIAERERRKEWCHRAMREDIETMHAELRTGFSASDLDQIVGFLRKLDGLSHTDRDSHALLPRARHAILERLRAEAGDLAIAHLTTALRRRSLAWPDPRQHPPTTTPEELESSHRRRLSDARASFLTYDFLRIAERLQGIVWGWGADYPDRGSPLWQESVLKGVAAALWGKRIEDFIGLLEKDREQLTKRMEQLMSKELVTLRTALENRTESIAETADAVARALRVLDEVVPEIAWELIRRELPEASNEAPLRTPEHVAAP